MGYAANLAIDLHTTIVLLTKLLSGSFFVCVENAVSLILGEHSRLPVNLGKRHSRRGGDFYRLHYAVAIKLYVLDERSSDR